MLTTGQFVEEQAIDRVHRLTQKIDVVVYKITIADTVEERILALQEKKRELAKQTIEGQGRNNAGKLGMKEILQLFRRDAEHAPLDRSAVPVDFASKPRVLKDLKDTRSSQVAPSQVGHDARYVRKSTSPRNGKAAKSSTSTTDDDVYGRRW